MRVLYVSPSYTPHDYRFLEALAATEYEVHYLRLQWQSNTEVRPLPPGILSVDHPDLADSAPRQLGLIQQVLSLLRPDLVHAGPVDGPAFHVAKAGFRPLITMSWASDLLVNAVGDRGRRIAEYTLQRSDLLFWDADVVREKALELHMPFERIVQFPWGVDLHRFTPRAAASNLLRLPWEDCFVLLSTRSFESIYDVDVVVEGFIAAARRDSRLRLLLLGDGSQHASLESRITESGMQDRVYFVGQIANDLLPDYYRAADVYVTASTSDGSSISLLEAMACGLPVIASDTPGNREWVQPGENGWRFLVGDGAALAGAIEAAASVPSLMVEMGVRCREIVEDRADWTVGASTMIQSYERVVHTSHAR